MIVVSNTTPIISLASIQRLDILEKLFGKIIVAEAVYNEIKAKQHYGYHEIDSGFIEVRRIQGLLYKDFLLRELDLGETETILLAKELGADYVMIDENLGLVDEPAKGTGVHDPVPVPLVLAPVGVGRFRVASAPALAFPGRPRCKTRGETGSRPGRLHRTNCSRR